VITPVRRTASHCLGERVVEYVARSLPDTELLACDRHLIICASCRKAVDDERRMLARLAVEPMMPSDLRTALLSLASLPPTTPPPPPEAPPAVRHAVRRHPAFDPSRHPAAGMPARLTVLAPSAPACHRSPLRSAVLAAVAAGASAAAAWSMAVTGATATATESPVVRPTGAEQPAAHTIPSAGTRDIWTVSATYTHPRLAALQAPLIAAMQTAYGTPRSWSAGASGAQSTP
jgi:hypothetical protein